MAGQVIEILFLREDRRLGKFLPSRVAPQHNRSVHLGSQIRSPRGVHTVRLAPAPLPPPARALGSIVAMATMQQTIVTEASIAIRLQRPTLNPPRRPPMFTLAYGVRHL